MNRVIEPATQMPVTADNLTTVTPQLVIQPPLDNPPILTQPTAVTVTSPAGGTFRAGDTLNVQWQTTGPVGAHAVLLSQDNGNSFGNVSGSDLPASARSFSFTLPAPANASVQAVVRVRAKDAPNGLSLATGNSAGFTLQQAQPVPLAVRVTQPSAPLTLDAGSSTLIEWTADGATNQRVQFVADNGDIMPIVTGLDGSSRAFLWVVPAGLVAAGQEKRGRIRVVVRNMQDQNQSDDSDVSVTLRGPVIQTTSVTVTQPNGGTFRAGDPLSVQWQTSGPVGAHTVLLSLDNGMNFSNVSGADLPAEARSFSFVLPAPAVSPALALIRVVARSAPGGAQLAFDDGSPFLLQAANSSDSQPPAVAGVALQPARSSYQPDEQVTISWNANDNVAITSQDVTFTLSPNGAQQTIGLGLPGNQRSIGWRIPAQAAGSVQIRVVARDAAGNSGEARSVVFAIAAAPTAALQVSPPNGAIGSDVLLSGNFAAVTGVRFGTLAAAEFFSEATPANGIGSVVAEVPAGFSSGPVQLITGDGRTLTGSQPFQASVSAAAPHILGVEPQRGVAGELVTITGLNFVPGQTVVRFKSAAGRVRADDIQVENAQLLRCRVPGAAVNGSIKVSTPNGRALSPAFEIGAAVTQAPRIDSAMPQQIAAGRANRLTLTGASLPEDKSAFSLEDVNGNPLNDAVVAAVSRMPPVAVLQAILPDAVQGNRRFTDVLRSRYSETDRAGWPLELLLLLPPGSPAGVVLVVRNSAGRARINLAVAEAAPQPLLGDSGIDFGTGPAGSSLLPGHAPDISLAALLDSTPAEIRQQLLDFGNRLKNTLTTQPAPVPDDAAAAAGGGESLLDRLGVGRAKGKPVVGGRDLRHQIRTGLTPAGGNLSDGDADGLPDANGGAGSLEDSLARAFVPFYHISRGEKAGTGFAEFQPNRLLRAVGRAVPASQPIVHYRVEPLGISHTPQGRFALVSVSYFTLWTRDDGIVIGNEFLASLLASLFGSIPAFIGAIATAEVVDAATSHPLDEEYSAVLLAAPLQAGEAEVYPQDVARYQACEYFTAAHEKKNNGGFDQSMYIRPRRNEPVVLRDGAGNPAAQHVELWLSQSKHATYHFDPDGLPLVSLPVPIVGLASALAINIREVIDLIRDPRGKPVAEIIRLVVQVSIVFYTVTRLLRVLLTERFAATATTQPGGDGYNGLPLQLINVGEPDHPLNGASWINETEGSTDPGLPGKVGRGLKAKFQPVWKIRNGAQPPRITGFSPASGGTDTPVTVSGVGLGSATRLTLNGSAVPFDIDAAAGTLRFKVPPGASSGRIGVSTPSAELLSSSDFIVTAAAVSQVSLGAPSGTLQLSAGQSTSLAISIDRGNFSAAIELSVAGLPAGVSATFAPNPVAGSTATLTLSAAPGAPAASGNLTVNGNASGITVTPVSLGYAIEPAATPAPTISSFSPASGPAGTPVTLTGTGLGAATVVSIGGIDAVFSVVGPNKLRLTVPATARSGPIGVTTPGGSCQSSSPFLVSNRGRISPLTRAS